MLEQRFLEFYLVFQTESQKDLIYDLGLGITLITIVLMVKLLSILIEFLYKFLPAYSLVHFLYLSQGLGVVSYMQSLSNPYSFMQVF